MSYSFSITASTKDEAGAKVEAELGNVVNGQPAHEADRQAAQNTAEAFINLLEEPDENENIVVSVSGWLNWREQNAFVGSSVSVTASLRTKTG